MSELIRLTLNIPFHLTRLNDHKFDLRMAYRQYLTIIDAEESLENMRRAGTWKQKSTFTDIVEVFMSKTVYHRNPSKVFPSVPLYPLMEKWLLNEDGAPTHFEVWKGQRQTYENLNEIIKMYVLGQEKKSSASNRKGKKRQEDSSPRHSTKGKQRQQDLASDSAGEMSKKKGQGKGKKTGDSSKKGSSSKSRD